MPQLPNRFFPIDAYAKDDGKEMLGALKFVATMKREMGRRERENLTADARQIANES